MKSEETEDTNDLSEIKPLFKTPQEWFNSTSYEYHLPIGEQGKVYDLTASGITFKHIERTLSYATKQVTAADYKQVLIKAGTITVVQSEEEANQATTPVGWVTTQGRMVKVYIHIPFESEATTPTELKTTLSDIFHTQPDLESLFNRATRVPNDI